MVYKFAYFGNAQYISTIYNFNSMIFTTKNKELVIFGETIGQIKKKWSDFVTIIGENGLLGENGAFSSLFSGKKPNDILTPEVLAQFNEFKEKFNSSSLSAEALAEQMENVDSNIIKYAKTCQNGQMTTEGFKASINNMSLSAKAGKVALQALAMAGNMIAMWAISKGIELVVKGIDKLVHSAEYAKKAYKEAANNAKSFSQAIKDIQKSTVTMESDINSIIDRYAQLSQGIDSFTNENKSLPTGEYEEFLDLNEQLAGLFPSLTRNYDDNGNAILGLSGSIDSVTESIRSLVEQEKELSKAKIRENIEQYFDGTDEADGAWKALEGRKKALEEANKELEYLTSIYSNLNSPDKNVNIGRFHKNWVYNEKHKYLEYIKNNFGKDIADAVESELYIYLGKGLTGQFADLTVDFSKLELTETQKEQIAMSYDTFYSELLAKQKTAMSEFDSQNSEFSNNAMLWLEDLSFYKGSDKYVQLAIQNFVRNIDWSIYDFKELDYDGVKRILQDSILTPFQVACEDPDTRKKLEESLKSLVSLGDVSKLNANEAVDKINAYIDAIAEILEKDPLELKVMFGFEQPEDIKKKFENSLRQITDDEGYAARFMYNREYDELLDFTKDFTVEQQELWLEATRGAENAAQAIEMWKAKLAEADSIDISFSDIFSLKDGNILTSLGKISESIDTIQNAYKTLSDAIDEYNEEGTFSIDTLQSVIALGDDWLDYLADENGALKLDKESLEQLTQSRLNDMRVLAINNVIDNISKIESDANADDYLKSTNYALAESYEELAKAKLEDARASMEAAVTAGTLSQENMDAAMNKAEADIEKIHKLFENTDISTWSITGKNKSSKDTIKEFDWIEQAIENVRKEIQSLDEIANSSYATFSQKNAALAKEIEKVSEEIALQQKAYEEYMRKADSTGLADHYKTLAQNGSASIEDISDEKLLEQIDTYRQWYDKAQSAADAIKELNTDLKDLHVSAYELHTEDLKDRLDNGSLTEKQYLSELKAAYERFYGNLEEYAQQYHEAVLDCLKQEKEYLNTVAGAAVSLLDTEIDAVRDSADEQEEQLKKQIELLEEKKKPLQEELDALEEKARKEDLILNLQKAQYDLARAENQRTKLVYKDGQLVYTNDSKAARDAQKGLDDAKLEIQKQSIQDRLDGLDEEISRYNDLIDQINKAADTQIKALEKIKDKWQEITHQQEYAKNITILTGEFGADAIERLLSGGLLEQWKNSYISILSAIDMETQGYIGEMTKQLAELYKGASDETGARIAVPSASLSREESENQPSGTAMISGTAAASGDSVLTPLQPGDEMYGMMQKWNAYMDSINGNIEKLIPYSVNDHNRQMSEAARRISNVSNVFNNNRNVQPVVNHINVTCPGVTEQQVAERLGKVIGKELDKQFNGFHNYVDQMSRIR